MVTILVNIVIPLIILTRFSKEEYLGPVWGLIIALLFPIVFGGYELIVQKQKSLIPIVGIVGVVITGVIGILKFPPQWIAVKEGAIPLIIGLIILYSTNKPWQLITKLLYTREIFNIDLIEERLNANGLHINLNRALSKANVFLSYSFFLSALINYFLAKVIVQSAAGTAEFNEEIGRLTMLSFPAIVVPSLIIIVFIFRYLVSSITKFTQLSSSEILSGNLNKN